MEELVEKAAIISEEDDLVKKTISIPESDSLVEKVASISERDSLEDLIAKVEETLYENDIHNSLDGIFANLKRWKENKKDLLELFRKHPNWNEEALAVVFEENEKREPSTGIIFDLVHEIECLHPIFDNNHIPKIFEVNDYAMYANALNEAAFSGSKFISKEAATEVSEYTKVSCNEGEKVGKVLNKICEEHGVSKHKDYNRQFAKLSDAVNPMERKILFVLSIHPCDYLEMSSAKSSWSSCHSLHGAYCVGTLSHMNDPVSIICYTVILDNKQESMQKPLYSLPKITRQIFCYQRGRLLQSRLYPQNSNQSISNLYSKNVKKIISECHQIDDLWEISTDVFEYFSSHRDSKHYKDYSSSGNDVKVYTNTLYDKNSDNAYIGNTAYCIHCGGELYSTDSFVCDDCDENDCDKGDEESEEF